MRWLYKLPLRLRSLFKRGRVEQELSDELRFHLEELIEEKVAKGMTPEEARYAALRELGGVEQIKEECRDMRRLNLIQDLIRDVSYGLRQLRRNPGFTVAAVAALALGVGANAAMFSIVNAVLLRPLPFRDPHRLVVVEGPYANRFVPTPRPHFEWAEWTEESKTLADFSIYERGEINLAGEGEPDRVSAAEVSEHFFGLLGVNPIRGRSFLPAEEAAEHPFVAVISYRLWRSRYSSSPGQVGKTIHLNGKPFTIVGIMPSGFEFPAETQIWVTLPHYFADEMFGGMAIWGTQIARLRPDATLDKARAELRVIAQRLSPSNSKATESLSVTPLHQVLVGDIRPALLLLFGAVVFVLLLACANVANLTLARCTGRFREVAVRAAIGASRARLVRQLLTESVLLSLLGGGVGLLIGGRAVDLAKGSIPARAIFTSSLKVDGRVLAFTFVVAVLTGVLSGLVPALQSSKLDLNQALKEGAMNSQGNPSLSSRYRLRSVLGIFEVATALVLLIGAGLLVRSFGKLLEVNPGFRTHDLLAARVSLLEPKYAAPQARIAFFQDVLARTRSLPVVRDAAFVNALPLGGAIITQVGLNIEGGLKFQPESGPMANYLAVSPTYFQTMDIPLLSGRDFTERDTKGSTPVAIISRSMAQSCWPNQNPLGKRFSFAGNAKESFEVVGMVSDVRGWDLAQHPEPTMYFPILQQSPSAAFLVIYSAHNPAVISAALRGVVGIVDKNEPISSIITMDQLISQSAAQPRFRTLLLGIFAGLAFLLAMVGVYSVNSYSVSQRTHEIGVRMALGAQRQEILGMVLREGMGLTVTGMAIGLVAALGLAHLLAGFLYGVRPVDFGTFVTVSLLLTATALVASYIPARRATRVDPMVALRHE